MTQKKLVECGMTMQVSVIIPTYNSEATIGRALDSVLAQTFKDYEVIVSDDASADRTIDVLRSYLDALPLRVVQNEQRKGPGAARNAALRLASGAYVAFLDSDDEWAPSKLSRQVAAMDDNPDASLCTCDARWIAPDGSELTTVLPTPTPPSGPDGWKYVLRHRHVATPCVVARRDIVEQCGGFNEELFVGQDVDLWIRLAFRGDVITLPDELVRYHITANSHIRRHHTLPFSLLLPKILTYLDTKKHELTPKEYREIKGSILFSFGRYAYHSRLYATGVCLLLRGVRLNGKLLNALLFIVSASPFTRPAKRWIRRLGIYLSIRRKSSTHHIDVSQK